MSEPKQFQFTHASFIEEKDINVSALPEALKNKLSQFATLAKQYEEEKTQKAFNKLEQLDALIADDLLTWHEDNSSDEDENESDYEVKTKAQEQAEAKAKAEEEAAAEAQRQAHEQRIAAEQEAAAKKAEDDALNAINQSIISKVKGSRIKRTDLEQLLGRIAQKSETLGSYKFKVVFLNSSEFEVQKN